jgi:long-chain acyl-CoA synthetase
MTSEEIRTRLTAPGELFEMDNVEIRGVRTRVWKHAPPTLRSVLEQSRAHGDRTFITYLDQRYTFAEHADVVTALAVQLVERYRIAKGDRVAIAMRNLPEWPMAFWAAAAVGAIVVPLNAWWTGSELRYGLADSGAKVIICDAARAKLLQDQLPGTDVTAALVVGDEAPTLSVPTTGFYDVISAAGTDPQLPDVEIHPDDDATIFYTSGTTGHPKGALGTNRNICTNLISRLYPRAREAILSGGEPPRTYVPDAEGPQAGFLLTVPLFHATGCHSVMLSALATGAKLVMMYKWDPDQALELIERERVTSFTGVPAMALQVLDSPSIASRDLSSLRAMGSGGAPAPPELVRQLTELVPHASPGNGYGLTETSAVATYNAGSGCMAKPESVGPPVAVVDVKVVDDQGTEVPTGEVGELWIKGPNVVRGYWNAPEATAASFTDGWLHTGDIARLDDEGFVYIVDRAKDMIIRGGENVYCVEVESALHEHPDVLEAAVVGVPHPVLGEEVGAVVQIRPGADVAAEDLRNHLRGRLAAFKVPIHLELHTDQLPRSPQGKLLKRELRAIFAPEQTGR